MKLREKVLQRWLGFDSREGRLLAGDSLIYTYGLVNPGNSITITQRPQFATWRGRRLCVHSPIAHRFLIHDVRVGNALNLASATPIPADCFRSRLTQLAVIERVFAREGGIILKVDRRGSELLGNDFPLPTAQCGTEITMVVENISRKPVRFLAGFLGDDVGGYS